MPDKNNLEKCTILNAQLFVHLLLLFYSSFQSCLQSFEENLEEEEKKDLQSALMLRTEE